MFSVEKNKLSEDLMPFDKQVTRSDEPLPNTHLTYIISGMKGSGKSTLLLNLLKRKSSPYYRWFDNIILFKLKNIFTFVFILSQFLKGNFS